MPKIHDHENEITYFARTNFRQGGVKFGIKTDDRRRHMYIIGKTGMGKTVLLENMVLQDVYNGHGLCYIDPHGDTVEGMLNFVPSWRVNDVVYFNPADLEQPIGFNVFDAVNTKHKHLIAAGLMNVFKKIWENMWSSRMEYILNNTILALLDTPGSTLMGINRMYSDEAYRLEVIKNIKDPQVKSFWVLEYSAYSEKYATEAVAAVQNKIGQFLSSDIIRNIVAQPRSTIDIREIMDSQKILLINLSKGRIGEENMRLLGGMLITKIQISAMERVDMDAADRKDFYLYVDEFQNFATEAFANILSEARKYRLNLVVAHQYMAQLAEEVADAVLGNVGTMIVFRIGAPDAVALEQEMMPRFIPEDMINLPKYSVYVKLMIDGVSSAPFSAGTLPPIAKITGSEEKVIRGSRERYGRSREEVEESVLKWIGFEEGKDVEEMIAESKARGAGQGGGPKKKKIKYKCSWTGKEFSIPVQLDRARPIYSEEGKDEVSELKKKGKYDSRKDIIYDEDLNAVGSVAELGSDGKWAQKDDDGKIVGLKPGYPKKPGGGGSSRGGGSRSSGGGKSSGGSSSGSSNRSGGGDRPKRDDSSRKSDASKSSREDKPKGVSLSVMEDKKEDKPAEKKEEPARSSESDEKPRVVVEPKQEKGSSSEPKKSGSSDGGGERKKRRRRGKRGGRSEGRRDGGGGSRSEVKKDAPKPAEKAPASPKEKPPTSSGDNKPKGTPLKPGQRVTFDE
ncbi:MAG TPA: type IV secretion system DNA-binding domain-containing protein [Patescibacteria group bacterium]|nr:type IV secretion system DNA-binding domain-containing protein [Patescibacteria group bacterium]